MYLCVFNRKYDVIRISGIFSTLPEAKTQWFVHLSFKSTLQLINGILSNLQKSLRHFSGTAIVAFIRIALFPSATVFVIN